MLIDSGMNIHNAKDIAKGLTDKHIELINTHADRDHIASNSQFDFAYMHLSETVNYYTMNSGGGEIVAVADGDELDLGGRILKVFALPGHTPGSIAILDVANRRLFSGDSVQRNGNIFMFGPLREFHAYVASLEQLKKRISEFDEIYPSHADAPIGTAAIEECINGARRFMNGELQGKAVKLFGDVEAVRYDFGYSAFFD